MDEFYKITLSIITGLLASFTQEYGLLLLFVTFAIVLDVVTGVIKVSCTDEVWDKKKASQGFWHKISLYIGLSIGVFLDYFLPFMASEVGINMGLGAHISYIFGAYIVLNELISACQNLQCCNSHILPAWVLKLLQTSAEQLDQHPPIEGKEFIENSEK